MLCCVVTTIALSLDISSSSSFTAMLETAVLNTLVTVGLVSVLFSNVSVASIKTVPVALGKVIVLSAVGSVTAKVVSKLSSVATPKIINLD